MTVKDKKTEKAIQMLRKNLVRRKKQQQDIADKKDQQEQKSPDKKDN